MPQQNRSYYLEVAIFSPLRQNFTYRHSEYVSAGCRVAAPFGRRKLIGVVVNCQNENRSGLKENKLKNITQCLDNQPIFNKEMLAFLQWAAQYYHHPCGEVFASALPARLRDINSQTVPAKLQSVCLKSTNIEEIRIELKRAPKQREIIEHLASSGRHMLVSRLKQEINASPAAFNALLDKQLLEISDTPPSFSNKIKQTHIELNEQQVFAVEEILNKQNQFHPNLLQGITGSGKTEVYLALTEEMLKHDRQTLILVPEISLSPQLITRFTRRFGDHVCVYHSALSDNERYQSWWRCKENHAKVILGTRSAIFSPLHSPGMIIVDEEHDTSYKQQDGFRYHARDMAVKRASHLNIPVVLGSATPSLESKLNANNNRYQSLFLNKRIGDSTLPKIKCIDTKKFRLLDGLSVPLIDALKKRITAGQQSILFLNRRGYAPVAQCSNCGWQAQCSSCDAFMTYHQTKNILRCHHCNRQQISPKQCPQCDSDLLFIGIGTQRLEAALEEHMPEARVLRLDRDNITTQNKLDDALNAIRSQQVDIIIGTQLIVKGHDFPNVTLVGVINSDQGLYSIDFRATEYLFQQLVQVAGRAGRANLSGEVLIQTAHPENEDLQFILQQNYEDFSQHCLNQRQLFSLPPYSHAAIWRAEAIDNQLPIEFLSHIKIQAEKCIKHLQLSVSVFDAVEAPAKKRIGHYRAQLYMTSDNRQALHHVLENCLIHIQSLKTNHKIRWSIDVDPVDMY